MRFQVGGGGVRRFFHTVDDLRFVRTCESEIK